MKHCSHSPEKNWGFNIQMNKEKRLYKYVNANGAEKILTTKSFRFSSPLSFNDPFDMQIDDLFPYDPAQYMLALDKLLLDKISSGNSKFERLHPSMPRIMSKFKTLSDSEKLDFLSEFHSGEPIHVNEGLILETQKIIQQTLSCYGIFCASSKHDSIVMWAHYADNHKGVVLEITPSIAKDSMFLASEPVRYMLERPIFYEKPEEYLALAMLHPTEFAKCQLERLTYSKYKTWEYESEYRLAIPKVISNDADSTHIPFHPEEITSIFLGCRMSDEKQKKISDLAYKMNNKIKIIQAKRSKTLFELEFLDL